MKENTKKSNVVFIVSIILLFVITILSLVWFSSKNKERIVEENRSYLLDTTNRVASSIDAAILEGQDNIKMLAALISNSLSSPDFDITTIQNIVKNSTFDFVEFADKDGIDHNITGGVSDATDRQYYLDAKAGNSGMELIFNSRATHETLLMFYSPVYYQDEFVGSIVGVYQASNKITKLLTNTYFGETSTAYLLEKNGRVIADSLESDPGTERYIQDIVNENKEVKTKIQYALTTGETTTFPLDNKTTSGCIQKLENNDWFVVQIFPPNQAEAMINSANNLGYQLVVFISIINLVILISVAIFYRRQRKEVEDALLKANVANIAKTNFLFNMSHDIRTPMNAIIGYTDIALTHIDDKEKAIEYLNKVKLSSKHLLGLINDILEMSRLESGNMKLEETPIDIRIAIEGVNQMGKALAIPKNIDFKVTTDNINNPYIYADNVHVDEMLINLISNAIKYTNNGGKVSYHVEQVGDVKDGIVTFRFIISDNGIGIAKEFLDHIFEPFSRENNPNVKKQEGSGLGLSIVRKTVELLGGTIKVESKQGVGTTFVVEIPFRVVDEETINKLNQKDITKKLEKEKDSFVGKRILLVEDNEMNREIAEEILTDANFIVDSAEDGLIANSKIDEHGPDYYDFVLMDIQMPNMNGYEATKEIRQKYPNAKLPIIALSANAFSEDKQESLNSGMNDHVSKPINIEELLDKLAKYI